MPFDGPLAPLVPQGSLDRSVITPKSLGEADEFGDARLSPLVQPGVEVVRVPLDN